MKKYKKRWIISICGTLIILALIALTVYLKRERVISSSRDEGPSSFIGKVVEELSETSVGMEVVDKLDSYFQENEQVIVEYEKGSVRMQLWDEEIGEYSEQKMRKGEMYTIQFWQKDIKKQDGKDVISLIDGSSPIHYYLDEYMEVVETCVVTGKVVSVDKQCVVLEVAKERGGYHIGDKLTVSYERAIVIDSETMEEKGTIKNIKEGDEYSFQMDKSKGKTEDCIKIKDLIKFES